VPAPERLTVMQQHAPDFQSLHTAHQTTAHPRLQTAIAVVPAAATVADANGANSQLAFTLLFFSLPWELSFSRELQANGHFPEEHPRQHMIMVVFSTPLAWQRCAASALRLQ